MKKLLKFFKSRSIKAKVLSVGLAISLLAAGGVVLAGFGPERPVFDWNNPDDRKGSLVGPVFNSFINTPTYGDERNFNRIAPVVAGQSPVEANFSETVTAENGKEYWVRTFVHNGANITTNCLPENKDAQGNCLQIDPNAPGVAKNTRVRIAIAEGQANGVDVMSYISADNAVNKNGQPMPTVWDSSTLVNDNQRFSVSYVPGSAVIYNPAHQSGSALPSGDQIVSSNGVQIGFDQMNGNLPGCFEFSAYVYVKVKVSAPDFSFKKQVRKAGDKDWSKLASVKAGEKVQWIVTFQNTGQTDFDDVTVSDQLPPHVELVPGSVRYIDAGQDVVQNDRPLFTTGGINFGTWKPNGGFHVRFDTVAKDNFEPCEVTVRNLAFVKSKQEPKESKDHADVRITRENCQPKQPVFRCDLLKAELVSGRKYKFTVNATAQNGATIKQYRFNFGDNTAEMVTTNNVVEHTFPEEGTFAITATVDFNVNGQVRSHTSEACKTTINTKKPPVPPVTPPTTLPVTGPGEVIGMFVAVTTAAGLAHRFVWARRIS